MPPYRKRASPFRRLITIVRQPWVSLTLVFGLATLLFLSVHRRAQPQRQCEKEREPMRTVVDNYQHLHSHPIANEEYLKAVPIKSSENAIVASMYNDAFAVPIVTLGHSLNKVNTTARKVLMYFPDQVSERALCIATASGWEPYAVDRIEPPAAGVHTHFKDQFTKLALWKLGDLGFKAVVYLDADTLVLKNFDELFRLPFNFAAVPDVYIGDPGFTIAFNAGVLFLRPSSATFRDLIAKINTADYPHWEAEQAFLNVFYAAEVVRLPYIYNGNMAIKKRSPKLWEGLKQEMRLIHYSLVKPFWREVYDEIGLDKMHDNVKKRMTEWDGVWMDEIKMWGNVWTEVESLYQPDFTKCAWKPGPDK